MSALAAIRFVILSVPRTGSNYLCSQLNEHPEILCHHELFNLDGIRTAPGYSDGTFQFGTMEDRYADPLSFLGRVWSRPEGHRALGFKLAWRHDPRVFQAVHGDAGVRKIVLDRRNRLKMYVSEQVALREGRWTHYHIDPNELQSIQVEIDVADMRRYNGVMNAFFDE
ncbi:MAG: hypothetical protein GKR94_07545 [Gammaproteobacteria bacterium]|nr:hypothetical protein [Gammaproteobacteria bacterium]